MCKTADVKAYPFPAFVVRLRKGVTEGDCTPLVKLEYVWGNEPWDEISGSGDIRGVLGLDGERALGDWLEREERAGGAATLDDQSFITHLIALPSVSISFSVTKTRIDSHDRTKEDERSLWVITGLEMVKLPRTPLASQRPAVSPFSNANNSIMSAPPTPIFDMSNRTSPLPAAVPGMVPPELDCRSLLQNTDWSLTGLGPREKWSPVVEMMISVVMRSPTQDSLWLGTDFNMI